MNIIKIINITVSSDEARTLLLLMLATIKSNGRPMKIAATKILLMYDRISM